MIIIVDYGIQIVAVVLFGNNRNFVWELGYQTTESKLLNCIILILIFTDFSRHMVSIELFIYFLWATNLDNAKSRILLQV